MGKKLSGAAGEDFEQHCDSRCKYHKGKVSKRVKKECTKKFDRVQTMQQAMERARQSRLPPALSTSAVPLQDPSQYTSTGQQFAQVPDISGGLGDYDVTTMPAWGELAGDDLFEYVDDDDVVSESDDNGSSPVLVPADPNTDTDTESSNEIDTRSAAPDYHATVDLDDTDVGYSSGSEADIDTDTETHPELDGLFPISAATSRATSPIAGLGADDMEDVQDEEPVVPNSPIPDEPDPAPRLSPEVPPAYSQLPDALRAFQELLLKLSSDGDLTVSAAESFLKTLNMCLEKDLLRCGPEADPAHRLPFTLETLQRHASQPSDHTTVYAVCPDFSCQTLRELSSMESDRPYDCAKCKKPITRQKITRNRGSRQTKYHYVPILQYAAGSIERQLRSILERPGILEAMEKHRQHLHREDRPQNHLEDIQHGKLWRNFKKGDTKFFDNPRNIGFILMCDGFEPSTRQGASTYSITAISLCIANLPPELRNRPENKILVGVTPGPREPNVDTINNFLKPMVDELSDLWKTGMTIKHPDDTQEIIYAALIACACDTPAARKVGGFPGTGSRYPCTACWCSHIELHVYDKKFPRRSREEHRHASKVYRKLPSLSQKKEFITSKYEKDKPSGYRYSALLRLPYWDPSTMVVVDPMHCLFLGLVNWQFHHVWVNMKHLREGHELKELQEMVESAVRPRHCGRPPVNLGTSAAGSLTSDPLRSLATIDFPLAIPVLWDRFDVKDADQRAHQEWARRKALEEKKKAEAKKGDKVTRTATKARQMAERNTEAAVPPRKRRRATQADSSKAKGKRHVDEVLSSDSDCLLSDAYEIENANRMEEPDATDRNFLSWRMQDAEGILLLASAIKHLCARTVDRNSIKIGQEKLLEYLNLTAKLRGAESMRPNHHFASHLAEQIERYGPMHQIWTYSGERLNFDLKNTNSNRHGGGEREMTFTATFHRRRECVSRLTRIAHNSDDILSEWAAKLTELGHSDSRGTARAEISDPQAQATTPAAHNKLIQLKATQSEALYNAFIRAQPDIPIRRAPFQHGDAPILDTKVKPIREVKLNGRTFSMSSFRDSIVKATVVENGTPVERVGEIVDLWEHKQLTAPGANTLNTFAVVRWYKASPIFAPRSVRLWSEKFPELDIEIYQPNDYLEAQAVVPVCDISCHCARLNANLGNKRTPVWLTIGLGRE